MKYRLLNALAVAIFFLMPNVDFGQAPTLGTAANFVLFTTNGAMTNSGIPHLTHLTDEVGSNLAASISGFGNVDGQMHVFDGVTGTCVNDVQSAYNQLNLVTPTAAHAVGLGSETLFAGVYHISANATLSSTLILDAQGNPNAVFIFQIQGTLSTTTLSKVTLINGGLACNVFWKVEGVVSMASGSTMRGTIIANNAAINLTALDTLEGRALSINGAVSVSELMAYTPIGCGSAVLTGPAAPPLVAAGAFGVFSSIGGVTASPVTYVIGDVGSNSTITTGFVPSDVTGTIHASPDATTAAAAANLTTVYNNLNGLAADIDLTDPANFGFDLVLTPHIYLLNAATVLNGSVYLNAEGDANAIFVIQVNGQFTTTTLSKIMLINGTQAKNVYWLINGAAHIFDNSVFNGTIVGAGAITLNTGDTLNGRALTINGAIAINGSYVNDNPAPSCVAAPITGTNNICTGSATTLSDADAGGTWSSSNSTVATIGSSSGIVTAGIIPGTAIVTYTSPLACVSTMSLTVTAGASPITGLGNVCVGSSIHLSDATVGGTWSSSNTSFATIGTASGIVTGVASGVPMITYTIASGCIATKSVTVGAASNAGTITGPSAVCVGSSITLSDGVAGGTWSSSNTNASVSGGTVTGMAPGTDTVRYILTSACGADTAVKAIAVNTSSNAGNITGLSSVCVGSSVTLSDNIAGGTWGSSNTKATVSGGMVTGASAGIDTISYSVNNGCGLATTTKTVTINASPNAGTITGPSSVCVGSFIMLSDNVPGGVWSSSNTTAAAAAGTVTGAAGGIDTIRYTVANLSCTSTATKSITVNASSNAGVITGASSVCIGSTILLSDAMPGGTWSGSNAKATVSGNAVTGVINGTDTIRYAVINACGSDTAIKIITITNSLGAGTITGPSSVCIGLSIALSDSVAGGVWSHSNTAATVAGGMVTGVAGGIDTVMYTVTALGCTATATKTVNVNTFQSAGSIAGPSSVCVGSAITLSDSLSGGIWSGSNATALVGGGMVIGSVAGTDTVSYTVSNVCNTTTATKIITVNPLPNAGGISGASTVCIGSPIVLSDWIAGGTWGSNNPLVASVSGVGAVTGISQGTVLITYAVVNSCGTATATDTITVLSLLNCNTGIKEQANAAIELSVYPNPNTGSFSVLLKSGDDEPVTIVVTNIVGEKVKEINTVTNMETALKLYAPSGVYFLSATTIHGRYTSKVVIGE